MSTATKRATFWAWMPAVLIAGASLLIAAGLSLIPAADAANEDVTMTGVIGIQLDMTPTCAGSALALNDGTTMAVGSFYETAADCSMDFSTNNVAGARLDVLNNRGGANAFCRVASGCGDADDELSNVTAGDPVGQGEFGMRLASVGGDASATWTLNTNTDGTGAFYPVAAASEACRASGSTASSVCTFRAGAEPEASNRSGGYDADIRFTATAL